MGRGGGWGKALFPGLSRTGPARQKPTVATKEHQVEISASWLVGIENSIFCLNFNCNDFDSLVWLTKLVQF